MSSVVKRLFSYYMFFEKYLSHCHMTFQYLVIQCIKFVMNTVTDKKSVTLLSHVVNRVFQRVEQLIPPSETTCFILLELLVSHGEIRSSIRQAPLFLSRNEEDKEYPFREPDDKR
mgnify:CR=1 FL=1